VSEPVQGQSERLVEQVVQRVDRWHLTVPTLLFLEATKPFSFIASQGLLLCQPLLGFLVSDSQVSALVDFLGDRANVEQLIARLDQGVAGRDQNCP